MDYKKDFDKWNNVKKEIDKVNQGISFREKDIWWCSVGVNIGSEEDGKGGMYLRPVLVYKKINSRMFIGIPITTVLKDNHINIAFCFEYNLHTMIIFQIKSFDSRRLIYKMGTISEFLYRKTKKTVTQFLR